MIVRMVHIRRWDVLFLFSFDTDDLGRIVDALVWASAPDSILQRVSENVNAGRWNEGFCYSDPSLRRSVAAVGLTSGGEEFVNSTVHEIMHIAQDVARTDGLDIYGESVAYLAGDLTAQISDIICHESCPNCRGKY